MRAVERAPWAEHRSPTHDAMCLAVASNPRRLFPRFIGEARAIVEAPIGPGFADVLAWTDAPPGEIQRAIVEVKTNEERTSAGDIIRQLRWYRQRLGKPAELVLVVPDRWDAPSEMVQLVLLAGIEVIPVGYFSEERE